MNAPAVPPLSAAQVAILQAWCERQPDVEKAWIYGSRARGRRRDPTRTTPSDIDLAVALSQNQEAQHDMGKARVSLASLRNSLTAYLAPHPHLFGRSSADAAYVALRIAFKGSDVQRFLENEPAAVKLLYDRLSPNP